MFTWYVYASIWFRIVCALTATFNIFNYMFIALYYFLFEKIVDNCSCIQVCFQNNRKEFPSIFLLYGLGLSLHRFRGVFGLTCRFIFSPRLQVFFCTFSLIFILLVWLAVSFSLPDCKSSSVHFLQSLYCFIKLNILLKDAVPLTVRLRNQRDT